MRVMRVYHSGRDPAHRSRESGLVDAGVELLLVVPSTWPELGAATREIKEERYSILELPVKRSGNVNRHTYIDQTAITQAVNEYRPDLVDIHEEPVSAVTRQIVRAIPRHLPLALYSAQNVDKRFPPPFAQYELAALGRATAIYPCSRQAASVVAGKGYRGLLEVLPLGFDPGIFNPGCQSLDNEVLTLGFVGRLVAKKGLNDAIQILASVSAYRPCRLLVVGEGPALQEATELAKHLGVAEQVEHVRWADATTLARLYQSMHVLLVPSRATDTWVEQFGRVIVEARAAGAVVAGYSSGSIPEVIGENGLLAPEGDAPTLAASIVQILSSRRWNSLRKASLESVSSMSWERIAAKQAALYEAATSFATPPGRPVCGSRPSARANFGYPAKLGGNDRPFALPVLRKNTLLARWLGKCLDMGNHVASRFWSIGARS